MEYHMFMLRSTHEREMASLRQNRDYWRGASDRKNENWRNSLQTSNVLSNRVELLESQVLELTEKLRVIRRVVGDKP
jgi:hypothetical protein